MPKALPPCSVVAIMALALLALTSKLQGNRIRNEYEGPPSLQHIFNQMSTYLLLHS